MKNPIKILPVSKSRFSEINPDDIMFGRFYSDHMFIAEYENNKWNNARIQPFSHLEIHPATSALHYGQLIFEGLKAYGDPKKPLLFRPEENLKRMNLSAARMGMPAIPEDLFLSALHELVYLDKTWIPADAGASLYIRPFMYAADEFIGIRPTEKFVLVIIMSPAKAYYNRPVKVTTSGEYVRAYPGGVGFAKAAGNYGATMLPLKEAIANGYDQVLWLDGIENRYVEEIGSMNVFFVIDDVFITPSLDSGTILDGITRDSVIQLATSMNIRVEQRKIDMDEIINANKEGRLHDAFGTGTAASVAPIAVIHHQGEDHMLPPVELRKWSPKLKMILEQIKNGKKADEFGWVVPVTATIAVEI